YYAARDWFHAPGVVQLLHHAACGSSHAARDDVCGKPSSDQDITPRMNRSPRRA
ncbi:hypothetical protein L195_g062871, partial [Trifolium pratense]